MEKLNRIIRIARILEDVRYMIESASEHNSVMALILLDYCNETVLKAIHYHLLQQEADKIWDCWKNIDKSLKSKIKSTGLSELPYKSEILNIIHRKRNFVQHSGESPRNEEVTRYLTYTELFIELVIKEILGLDFKTISPSSIIKNKSYRLLIDKAIEFKDKDPKLAGAFVNCSISYANGSVRDKWSDVDKNLGWKISHLFNKTESGDFLTVFTDIGNRIEKNTKLIEAVIREGCNPPKEILQKLPSGFLAVDQSFSYTHQGYNITSDEVSLAVEYAVRYICKLEKIGLLSKLDLDLERGIKLK